MDFLTRDDLQKFLITYPDWCVSLYLPTHRSGRETEQDPIRLKNLLKQAEEGLLAEGMRLPDARKLLKPAEDLLQDPSFWRHQSEGLAVFIAPDLFETYRLPLVFENLAVIAHRFHFKPLLPLFAADGHFYILALSQNEVRLLEATPRTVDEINLEETLPDMARALRFDDFEKQLQFHTETAAPADGKRRAMYHSHNPAENEKARILHWFHKVDASLRELLAGEHAPLVLAGVEYLFPLYKEANTYPHLVGEGVAGNPEELRPEELHAAAWPLVRPIFTQEQDQAVTRYGELAAAGLATNEVREALLAAYTGRVDTLFTALDVQLSGHFDPLTGELEIHPRFEIGDEDLLNLAALQTLTQGGTVYAVEAEYMPAAGSLAAILRY